MPDIVTLLVGTTKGLFLIDTDDRAEWTISGPHCDGWPINHAIGDPETGTIWAAGGNDFTGAGVWRSDDLGATWSLSLMANGQVDEFLKDPDMAEYFGRGPADPAPFTGEVEALWSLGRSNGALYTGSKPANLFESHDGGHSWTRVEGLATHESRNGWQPGGAGLVLHTIVPDPENASKLWLGISAAGVFATEDGGATWERRNRRSNARVSEDDPHHGEVGHCVHNMVQAGGDLLYQQNHHGVFRSQDGGRSWDEISAGLPSTFGFPIAVHPRDPHTIWVLPLNSDIAGRYPPDAAARVWRSRDGGDTWRAHDEGLPTANCFFTVLRQAMATDRAEPAGIYFGTNSGSVFASRTEGETWDEIARHLPTILGVEVMDRG